MTVGEEALRWVIGVPGALVALTTISTYILLRLRRWTSADNARRGSPDLLATYLDLYGNIPSYVPARQELLATIQEMTLDLAHDPARIADKRASRKQYVPVIFGVLLELYGLLSFRVGMVLDSGSMRGAGMLFIVFGLVCLVVFPVFLVRLELHEARRTHAKRAVFIEKHLWPDDSEIPLPPFFEWFAKSQRGSLDSLRSGGETSRMPEEAAHSAAEQRSKKP